MTIVGHGIDVFELARVRLHLAKPGGDWLDAVFTQTEQLTADAPPNHIAYYAGRYAAKEAVVKALGTGFSGDVTWLDVEVFRRKSGSPAVRLLGGAAVIEKSLGIVAWHVSISHSQRVAVASAIATGKSIRP